MRKTKRILWLVAVLAAVLAIVVAGCKHDGEDEWTPVTIRGTVLEKYSGQRTTVTIPDGVTSIGSKAFSGSGVTAVIIPSCKTIIAADAFVDSEVKSVSFIVTDELPGDEQTEVLRKAGIKVSCFIIENDMLIGYEGNETIVVIPAGYVKGIADGVFQNCAVHTEITGVTIPGSVKSIGANAFEGCTALAAVRIEAGVAYIGDGAFARCTALTSMVIPAGVTELGGGIFTGCTNLTELHIHESVTTIASGALTGTEGLKDIYYTGRKAQWEKLVAGKEQYFAGKTVHCANGDWYRSAQGTGEEKPPKPGDPDNPDKPTCTEHTWGEYKSDDPDGHYRVCTGCGEKSETVAHEYDDDKDAECNTCGYTREISGDSECEHVLIMEHNESGHFQKCTECGYQSASVTHNYDGATYTDNSNGKHSRTCMAGCGYTETEEHSLGECENDGAGGHQKTCTAKCGYSEPVDHKWSDGYTADAYKHYKTCKIGCTVHSEEETHKYDGALYKDDGNGGHYQECTVCKHPSDSVDHKYEYEKINDEQHKVTCKENCGYFNDEEHVYDDDTDTDCNNCGYKRILKPSPGSLPIEGGTLTIGDKGEVTKYTTDYSTRSVDIPAGITGVGDYAFQGNEYIQSVMIPNTVTSIGTAAFAGCGSLTAMDIPDGVTSIGNDAFQGCNSLSTVTIPNTVTTIGDSAFYGCGTLSSVVIPYGVTVIGKETFFGCSSLLSVAIPESVTSIGYGAFRGCGSLNHVEIPKGVTNIGDNAFYGCSSLTEIKIPATVTTIGKEAFSLSGVKTITYAGTSEQWLKQFDADCIGIGSDVMVKCSDGTDLPGGRRAN
ncbi:MAG: leucine-rich repeat domain-containing protein [Treponemataceae bacterium]|nr:leucine-rich repeat domain-containing protein [Treponemataceae bacterium]